MLTEHIDGEFVMPRFNFHNVKSLFRINTAVVPSLTQCNMTDTEKDVISLPEGFHADP